MDMDIGYENVEAIIAYIWVSRKKHKQCYYTLGVIHIKQELVC